MATTVDARGLSCPQPVIMALDAIRSGAEGALVVLVDTETSKENVSRAAASQGWRVDAVSEEEGSFRLDLVRG